jgi:hypothetical protein
VLPNNISQSEKQVAHPLGGLVAAVAAGGHWGLLPTFETLQPRKQFHAASPPAA